MTDKVVRIVFRADSDLDASGIEWIVRRELSSIAVEETLGVSVEPIDDEYSND
ncbi:hypothetical protein [Halorubrum salsamenti]|uniref:hypothetical protein n=1 Tax=Halorubrum salsamenti TaxID=2583990 RepID=UPI001642B78A|nr:hypothetical protein [Halorubrum salsamenti]